MALISCKECGSKVGALSPTCGKCGTPTMTFEYGGAALLVLLTVLLGTFVVSQLYKAVLASDAADSRPISAQSNDSGNSLGARDKAASNLLVLKAGWSEMLLSTFTAGCMQGVAVSTHRSYAVHAAEHGKSDADFSEEKLWMSFAPMCDCISRRIATTWDFSDFNGNSLKYASPLVDEALNGGRCKPEGFLDKVLSQRQ